MLTIGSSSNLTPATVMSTVSRVGIVMPSLKVIFAHLLINRIQKIKLNVAIELIYFMHMIFFFNNNYSTLDKVLLKQNAA